MLSKKTKYGIKALTYLAKQNRKCPVQISEIAENENISIKFLERILLELRKEGVLGSKKGKGGGYFLEKSPEDISMTVVIRTLALQITNPSSASSKNTFLKSKIPDYRDCEKKCKPPFSL